MKNLNALLVCVLMLSYQGISQTAGVEVFINELHYDNAGADVGESVEIAGPAGTDLSTFTLTLYNGNNGASYETIALTGTIPDEGSGYGTLCFSPSSIQNGAPDGLALSDASANFMFISYEGTFAATDGPANGATSIDMGVAETGSTPSGESLQLTGTGTVYSDFTWTAPSAESPCAVNTGQNFTGGCNTFASITETACVTYTVPSGDETYTTTGVYSDTIPNAAMCDSIITINLTINPEYNENASETICSGDTYTFGAQSLTTSGNYTEVFTSAAGCDSTVNLTLTVVSSYNVNETASICDGDSYTLGTQTLTTAGTFTEVFTSTGGCDSTVNLTLTILQNTTSSLTLTECDSYLAPDGTTYTSTGMYTAIIPNAAGCDSTISIDLTINNSTSSSLTESACGSYTLNSVTYTASGVFTQTIPNAAGCDSVITLTLDITPTPALPTVSADAMYCDGETPADLMAMGGSFDSLIISGVSDCTLPGGLPKCIEFYAVYDIADLSAYGFGSANNGQGTDGEEHTFPAIALTAGDYYRIGSDSTNFNTWFGIYPNEVSNAALVNGDDAIELFHNGAVIDVFGDINVDGSGEPWEYLDGWAHRNTNALPNGATFDINQWSFSGPNALDGESDNATAATPFPIGTFTSTPPTSTITWYSDAALTTTIGTGNTLTPGTTIGATSYYVTETYTGTSTCEGNAAVVEITINELPVVTFGALNNVCDTDAAFTLTEGSPAGGTYSGTSVSGDSFDPSVGPGTYTLTYEYTDANGCTNTATSDIVVDDCASLIELDANAISVSPNPTTGLVEIAFNNVFEGTIIVTDAQGKVVIEETMSASTEAIDLSHLENGTYLLIANSATGVSVTRVVKQ